MTSLGFRDPWRTFGDVWEDPWMVPTGVNYPTATTGRQRTAVTNRMICMDAFETDQEFRVIIEVT